MALLMRRISGSKAAVLWNRAKNAQLLRPREQLVLKLLTVDDAATRWTTQTKIHSEKMEKYSPIGVLASMVITERKTTTILPNRLPISDQAKGIDRDQDQDATSCTTKSFSLFHT